MSMKFRILANDRISFLFKTEPHTIVTLFFPILVVKYLTKAI